MGSKWDRIYCGELIYFFEGSASQILQAQQLLFFCEAGTFRITQLNMYNFHKIR